jgi:cell division protein FtsB
MITLIDFKYVSIRVLFALQLIICAWVYWCGTHGLHALLELRQECAQLKGKITDTQQQIVSAQEEIIAWNAHPFYKEKMARERLNMARKGEIIYRMS